MIQDLAPGIVIYARRMTKMKMLMMILIGIVLGFLLLIMGYIMIKYLGVIFRRIDYYFIEMELKNEEQEINEFKKKL